MNKEQFNIQIKPSTRERIERFTNKNSKLFSRRAVKSEAAELLLEIGLDIAEKEDLKPKDK